MTKTDPNRPEPPGASSPYELVERELIRWTHSFAERNPGSDEPRDTPIPELTVLRRRSPTALEATLYVPSLCLILQGAKEVHVGTQRLRVAAGHSVIVSHHLPIVARVTEAHPERPFLALVLGLDLSTVRSLHDEIAEAPGEPAVAGVAGASSQPGDRDPASMSPAGALEIARRDFLLLEALARLVGLLERPTEIPVVAPLVLREIHYRLLLANHGAMLRQLVRRRSHAHRIAKAIAWIRENFAEPTPVRDLARVAGMSPSTFHQHFKNVTATTPLRYQKDIRLLAARELLRDGRESVSGAAFEVGYESPSQFSREYTRKFGVPPSQEIARPDRTP